MAQNSKDPEFSRPIARRDFLQGAAITTLAAGLAPELAAAAEAEKLAQNDPSYYPPTRLGLRGNDIERNEWLILHHQNTLSCQSGRVFLDGSCHAVRRAAGAFGLLTISWAGVRSVARRCSRQPPRLRST